MSDWEWLGNFQFVLIGSAYTLSVNCWGNLRRPPLDRKAQHQTYRNIYMHEWWLFFFVFYSALFCIWYLIFGIWYLSENLKTVVFFFLLHRMWSSADYDGLSQQYWSTIHNGLKYTIHQKKGKKLHYKTSFVWTIIIGLNSVFPLFSAHTINYKCVFFSFVKARFNYYWFKMLTKV